VAQLSSDPLNLDSLLDTMSNVVGILIVLVAVSQFGIGEAVERIRLQEAEGATQIRVELDAIEAAGARLDGELARSREVWAGLSEKSSGLRAELAATESDLVRLQRLPANPEFFGLGAGELSAELDKRTAQRRKLEEAIGAAEAKTEATRGRWQDALEIPSEIVTRLPDPRPAPAHLKPATVLCRYGRAGPVALGALIEVRKEAIGSALGVVPGKGLRIDREDGRWIENHFGKIEVAAQGLRWETRSGGPYLGFFLSWLYEQRGETAARLRQPDAALHAWLSRVDAKSEFVRLAVWPDSFEVYLEARAQAEKLGLHVGWTLFNPDDPLVLTTQLNGFQID
jgi:hypothetical protein